MSNYELISLPFETEQNQETRIDSDGEYDGNDFRGVYVTGIKPMTYREMVFKNIIFFNQRGFIELYGRYLNCEFINCSSIGNQPIYFVSDSIEKITIERSSLIQIAYNCWLGRSDEREVLKRATQRNYPPRR